ncbi:MAG: hypothetical protein K2K63_10375 [Acetatifactor sp.]|nr:hypothetical protein [Acetatifactor sp.]
MNRLSLLIAAVMLTMLTACGADKVPGESAEQVGYEMPGDETATIESGENAESADHEYEKSTITYSEPIDNFSFRKDLEKNQTDYAAYYFEPSVSKQERNACIAATDRMLSRIDTSLPDIEVMVLKPESYDGVSVTGNRLYLSPQPWDSADYLAKVLLAGYGEWGNYGLAYGYANYLCKKAGLDSGEAYSESDRQKSDSILLMSAPELYDLNMLCFDDKFVSAEDVEAAKNNACMFVNEYLSSHSEEEFLELLSASGTVEGVAQANEVLEEFYAENSIECSLTEIRYQFGGVLSDYAAACEYACFYIGKDWQDNVWEMNPRVSENFLHEDYREIREFFECNKHQMRQYQELFGFDSYDNTLSVLLKNSGKVKATSYYGAGSHTIYLESVVSLMHEYIHSVMFGHCDWESHWKTEGFARYFSYKYDIYSDDLLNEDWNSSSYIWVQEYIDSIGRAIDIRTDFRDIEDIYVHALGYKNPNSTYLTGSCFIGYLVDQYGEQAAIAYVCSDNEYNAEWGKSYDELVQDWNQYIEDNYAQYSLN